eukprot:2012216-Lingulodinium_polyedra.AAC.1
MRQGQQRVRVHVCPRCALFHPVGARGPDFRSFQQQRTTQMRMERASNAQTVQDANWCEQHTAERDMGRDWTGRTIFTEGVSSYEIRKRKNGILKVATRHKPTL